MESLVIKSIGKTKYRNELFFSIERKNNYFYLAGDNEDERSYRKGSCRARVNIEQFGTSINTTVKSCKKNLGLICTIMVQGIMTQL
jgi:hypothetical protein